MHQKNQYVYKTFKICVKRIKEEYIQSFEIL